ncbi:hypothetical protein [Roseibium polysiphoniae]|uniref:Uncharacterized protein n=1 Tax=Roseibium polysiphoniae TaxID=2571221 RepID=A0ABR9C7E3_9HYPH|nr:hypothetical protein [Roseibium polysiphoniae]MBD8875449.1 hypothetical protein [Roseibium polysiphoniae]
MIGVVISFFIQSKTGRFLAAFLLAVAVIASVYALGQGHALIKDRAKDLEASLEAEQERKSDDAALQRLSDYRLCLEYFSARSLSEREECEALRRVHAE